VGVAVTPEVGVGVAAFAVWTASNVRPTQRETSAILDMIFITVSSMPRLRGHHGE
jgi:hypothetical protein